VGDHHALGAGRGAARIVDGEQVVLADLRFGEVGRMRAERGLVVDPAVPGPFQRDEMLDIGQIAANSVDRVEVIGVGADHPGAAVVDDVPEFIRLQPEVDRHQHGADLRDRVEGLELSVRVGRDTGDPITLADAQTLKRRGPAVAAGQELAVREPQIAVDDRFPIRIEPPRPASELDGRQWCFHDDPLPPP